MKRGRSGEWSVMLFVAALLVFNPPILSIFSLPELLFGIPILYLYIFVAWGVVIALLAANVSRLAEPEDEPPLRIPEPEPTAAPEALIGSLGDREIRPGESGRAEG